MLVYVSYKFCEAFQNKKKTKTMKVSEGIHVPQQLVLNNNSEIKRAYAIQRDYVAHVVNQLNANVPKHLFKFFFSFFAM